MHLSSMLNALRYGQVYGHKIFQIGGEIVDTSAGKEYGSTNGSENVPLARMFIMSGI